MSRSLLNLSLLPCPALSCLILSCPAHPILTSPALSSLVMSHLALSFLVMSHLALSSLVMSHLAPSCPAIIPASRLHSTVPVSSHLVVLPCLTLSPSLIPSTSLIQSWSPRSGGPHNPINRLLSLRYVEAWFLNRSFSVTSELGIEKCCISNPNHFITVNFSVPPPPPHLPCLLHSANSIAQCCSLVFCTAKVGSGHCRKSALQKNVFSQTCP